MDGGWIDGWNGCGWLPGWLAGWMDGWMDGWIIDGLWIDG